MNVATLLIKAGVPEDRHAEALACLKKAGKDSNGLLWAKWKVRLFKAKKISRLLKWSDERIVDLHPELADWDIAPVINITAHGDNAPWDEATHRPVAGAWMNDDPGSLEHQAAVKDCYWSKGNHPRSTKARKDWYRRNAGEYFAYRLGLPVSADFPVDEYLGDGVRVLHCAGAWQLTAFRPLFGRFGLNVRVGYEIDNVFRDGVQQWYPIPGYDLRAPLTYSVLPGRE